MVNSEKLSLFRSGVSDSIGLTDVPFPKPSLRKLSLNKETISNLNSAMGQKGNVTVTFWITGGCTDGCGGSAGLASWWNCTQGGCTNDCQGKNSACVCRGKD